MSIDYIVAVLITVVGASTPILFAGLGELITEKSGVLNLGVEGMMLVGAIAAFATVDQTGNPWLAVWLTDNGHGGAATVPGHGLSGLAERVHGLRGELVVDSPAGGPTVIGARLPLT